MFSIEKATLADCPLIQTLASNIWGTDLWFHPLPRTTRLYVRDDVQQ